MHYSQPQILRTDDAVRAIQSVGKREMSKPVGPLVDIAPSRKATTPNTYEADE